MDAKRVSEADNTTQNNIVEDSGGGERKDNGAAIVCTLTGLVDVVTAFPSDRISEKYKCVLGTAFGDLDVYNIFHALVFGTNPAATEPNGYFWTFLREHTVEYEEDRLEIERFLALLERCYTAVRITLRHFEGLDSRSRVVRAQQLQKDVERMLLCMQGDQCSAQRVFRDGALAYFRGSGGGSGNESLPRLQQWWSRSKRLWKQNPGGYGDEFVADKDICAETNFAAYAGAIGWVINGGGGTESAN